MGMAHFHIKKKKGRPYMYDREIAGIIDDVIPRADRETGPSIDEYFLYCIINRIVEAVSKNQLAKWYQRTAIQHIRPVDMDELNSKRYWKKWDRID